VSRNFGRGKGVKLEFMLAQGVEVEVLAGARGEVGTVVEARGEAEKLLSLLLYIKKRIKNRRNLYF
jgi:hypothetical protein